MRRSVERRRPLRTARAWRRASVWFAGAFLSLAAWGQTAGAAAPSPAVGEPIAAKDARAWMQRLQEAPQRRNFQGTFVVTAGGAVSSARIAHYQVGPQQFERIESLDGQARQVFRHNELVHTLWPQTRLALVEHRDKVSAFPAMLQGADERTAEFYEFRLLGDDRVAGREAQVLAMVPRDEWRFAYRLWADRETGLLLRADVLNAAGERLESSAFSEVAVNVRPQADAVLSAMKKLDGYRVVRPTPTPTQLAHEGWTQKRLVPGFRTLSCIRRVLAAAGEAESASAPQVLQTVYSDGLTYVSVFIEPYSPERHTRAMLTNVGATHTLMMRQGDWWFTAVGDVPGAALRAFVKGIERAP
ncbi:MucB/RseB C-terminal domain-containing protein [Piscinibacter sakaiensis]|uniref:MucB/RseB C-terminal domain-containing protein n=1 Tax=Piscinibacter sakaiensis TaxID=1547922 RepID=UPI0009EB8517|nr:MucB/RseB C-terminal domain-containing protein [Piscinibacter sakaiensis]